jgi:hypothetical protein
MKRIVAKLMADKPRSAGERQRETRELRRLETLIDSVFALVIVVIVFDLPEPDGTAVFDLASYVQSKMESLFIAMVGDGWRHRAARILVSEQSAAWQPGANGR